MKYNRQSFWQILGILPLTLILYIVMKGEIHTIFWIFLILSGIVLSVATFWNNHYFSSLEETLYTFSNAYNGTVTLVKVNRSNRIIEYDMKGDYYGRAFHIKTECVRQRWGNSQTMNVYLKIDSPVITSLKLKRKRWGKVDLDPATIADVYDIYFTLQQQIPIVGSFYDEHFVMFRNEFINLVDQRKLSRNISILGKKYRDHFGRFYIFTNGNNIMIDKCPVIRSVDDLEKLMSSLKEIAEIIEDISKDQLVDGTA